jgi:hypothetical protein
MELLQLQLFIVLFYTLFILDDRNGDLLLNDHIKLYTINTCH